jgi:hypothetical protein
MSKTTEKAAAALDLLPEEMREPAVAYLLEQAEKFRTLKEMVAEGLDDVANGRVSEWNLSSFCGRRIRWNDSESRNEGSRLQQGQPRPVADLFVFGSAQSICRSHSAHKK